MSRTYQRNSYTSNSYRAANVSYGSRPAAHTVRIRKAVQRRSRARFALIAALCIAAGILFGMMLAPQTSQASLSYKVNTRYTSIRVEDGMTLTSLAKQYNTDHVLSDRAYIAQVQELNGVYDGKIQSGSYLTIPYYEKVQDFPGL